MPPGLAWTPTGRSGWSISSSRPRQANGPTPFAWWPGSSDRAGPSGSGKTISGAVGCLPTRSAPTSLFVAYFASAELGCHLALGWPLPARVLDLYVEFRNRANGLSPPNGFGLLGALAWHGLDAMDAAEKESMRELAIRGGPWTAAEREALLAYCESDVLALAGCSRRCCRSWTSPGPWPVGAGTCGPWPGWNGPECRSISETLSRLRAGWESIQDRLIRSVDSRFGVFDGRTFKAERWAGWLARYGIPWPRLESGELALDDDTFREMARAYPDVALMRELRVSLSQLRLRELAVGSDGRNRTLLVPVPGQDGPEPALQLPSSSSGRRRGSGASSSRSRAGPWPTSIGRQQEFGIAAALSGDAAMMDAYRSGDPYLAFGKQAGRIPADGTKRTHGAERELFKACVLGVQYGMGAEALARRIGKPTAYGSGAAPAPSGDLPEVLAMVGRGRVPRHAARTDSIPCSAGRSASAPTPTRVRSGISRARPTGPRCCGWPVAWRRSGESRSWPRSTTPCWSEGPADAIDEVVAADPRGDGGGVGRRPGRVPAPVRRQDRPMARSVHGRTGPGVLGPSPERAAPPDHGGRGGPCPSSQSTPRYPQVTGNPETDGDRCRLSDPWPIGPT